MALHIHLSVINEQLAHLDKAFKELTDEDELAALFDKAEVDVAELTDDATLAMLPDETLAFTQSLSQFQRAGGSLGGPASSSEAREQAASPNFMAARHNFLTTAARYHYILCRIERVLKESEGQGAKEML